MDSKEAVQEVYDVMKLLLEAYGPEVRNSPIFPTPEEVEEILRAERTARESKEPDIS